MSQADLPQPRTFRSSGIQPDAAVRIAVAALLLAAAALKLHALATGRIVSESVLTSPPAQFAAIQLEALLGAWLLLGGRSGAARRAAVAFFALVSLLSLYAALRGQRSCGCFGIIAVSPWITLGVDALILVLLVVVRPPRGLHAPARTSRRETILAAATVVAFVAAVAAADALVMPAPAHAWARLRGESVVVDPPAARLGDVRPDEHRPFAVTVSNLTARPMRLVGCTSNCSCRIVSPLPVTVPPGGSARLELVAVCPSLPGAFERKFVVFTDASPQTVAGRVVGRVLE
ncbi:MAG: hypothetical protein HYS13_02965 [Planctomycetia bacterium]|nr:hypothetical protein [Planctomycetia bacterium]